MMRAVVDDFEMGWGERVGKEAFDLCLKGCGHGAKLGGLHRAAQSPFFIADAQSAIPRTIR
jgi:hypothetical protein